MDVLLRGISDAFRQQNNGGVVGFALNTLENDLERNGIDELKAEVILKSLMNWNSWYEEYIKPVIKDFAASYAIGLLLMLVLPTLLITFACYKCRSVPKSANMRKGCSCQLLSAILIIFCYFAIIFFVLSLYENEQFYQKTCTSSLTLTNLTTNMTQLPFSLSNALQQSYAHIHIYLSDTVNQCHQGVSPTVDLAVSDILALMRQVIQNFMTQLMQRYNVAQLFANANNLFDDLDVVITNIEKIKSYSNTNLQSLWQFSGSLDMLRKNLLKYELLCKLPLNDAELATQCNQIMEWTRSLKVTIDTKQIDFLSGPALVYMMDKMKFNMTALSQQFIGAEDSLAQLLESVKQQVVNLPLDEASNAVRGVCDSTWSVFQQILTIASSLDQDVPQMASQYVKYWSAIYICLFCISALCLCCVSIGGIYGVFPTILAAFEGRPLFKDDKLAYVESTSNSSSSTDCTHLEEDKLLTNITFCNKKIVLYNFKVAAEVVPTIGAVLLIFLFAIVTISFLVGAVLNTEVCRYIAPNQNVSELDNHLDKVIEPIFRTLLAQFRDSQGHYKIKVQNITIGLNLNPPQHLFNVLMNDCRVSNQSILKQLGLTNVINVSALVYSEGVQELLSSGKSMAKQEIGKLDASSMIPDGITSVLDLAKDIVSNFIDKQNYISSLTELNKTLIGIPISYDDYLNQFQNVILKFQNLYPKNNDVLMVVNIFENLKILPYQEQINGIKDLRKNFLALQSHRNITSKLSQVAIDMNLCTTILANKSLAGFYIEEVYDGVMPALLSDLSTLLTKAVDVLESSIGDCKQLNAALKPLQSVLCDGILSTWFYQVGMLALASIFLQVCSILLLCQSRSQSIYGLNAPHVNKKTKNYENLERNGSGETTGSRYFHSNHHIGNATPFNHESNI